MTFRTDRPLRQTTIGETNEDKNLFKKSRTKLRISKSPIVAGITYDFKSEMQNNQKRTLLFITPKYEQVKCDIYMMKYIFLKIVHISFSLCHNIFQNNIYTL